MAANGRDLTGRLRQVLHDGNLTVSDLARWFDRSPPTVAGWVRGGHLGGAQLDAAYVLAQLDRLEQRIRRKQGFPVPRLSPTQRIGYLAKIKASSGSRT